MPNAHGLIAFSKFSVQEHGKFVLAGYLDHQSSFEGEATITLFEIRIPESRFIDCRG